MKHANTLCGQNAELFSGKAGDAHSYHCALKGSKRLIPAVAIPAHVGPFGRT
jgi:hypothetical protein